MKNIAFSIVLSLFLFGCTKEQSQKDSSENTLTNLANDTVKLGHSMKGWELYSWAEGQDWKYSFLVGTNRGKNLSEVLTSKFKVTGVDSLKMLLNQLPADEHIFWTKRVGQDATGKLAIPGTQVQNEVKAYCESRKLKLYISN